MVVATLWIESHASLRDHPKLKRLSRFLGISKHEAIGLLHCLWWWAQEYVQNSEGSVIPPYEAEDIKDATEWAGGSDELLSSLIKAGFLDESNGKVCIHDWGKYIGKLLARLEKDRQRHRKS